MSSSVDHVGCSPHVVGIEEAYEAVLRVHDAGRAALDAFRPLTQHDPEVEFVFRLADFVRAARHDHDQVPDVLQAFEERAVELGDDLWLAGARVLAAHAGNGMDPLSQVRRITEAMVVVEEAVAAADGALPSVRASAAGRVLNAASLVCTSLHLWELADEVSALARAAAQRGDGHTRRTLAWNRAWFAVQQITELHLLGEHDAAAARATEALEQRDRVALEAIDRPIVTDALVGVLRYAVDPEAGTAGFERAGELVELAVMLGPAIGAAWVRDDRAALEQLVGMVRPHTEVRQQVAGLLADAVEADLALRDVPEAQARPVRHWQQRLLERQEISRRSLLASARGMLDERRRAAERDHLRRLSHEDPLTGLQNRRGYDRAMAGRVGRRTVLLLLDLDDFKPVNDTHGHGVGDEVLKRVADAIVAELRADDVACRLGGDEFAVVLAGEDLETGVRVAHRVCERLAEARWDALAPGLGVGVSVGVAVGDGPGLYDRADSALYRAKASSGRVEVAADAA